MSENEAAESSARHGGGLPSVSPDVVEQDFAADLDDAVPSRGYALTPVLGLGASAGGIQALVEVLKAAPTDAGVAFVVILHLSPTHESTLPSLLGRTTSMPVAQAEEGQEVVPNHVYVIPPGQYLTIREDRLHLSPLDVGSGRGRRVAVDVFFRSLADSHGPHAMAAVFSGVDGDGAVGIKRIKERGGLTIAQDPSEAEQAGMPQSAIATGMVDWVLRSAEVPGRVVAYLENEGKLRLPPEDPSAVSPVLRPTSDDGERALREILLYLRTRTGRDFTCYKRATVLRRIGRRMQVNSVAVLADYLGFLRTHPGEAGALFQDLLISVTNFFRDREAFEALEARLPPLFAARTDGAVRAWVPACATGEEAYSVAMLLSERAGLLDFPPPIQVFACDLNNDAIQVARAGHYPRSIEADVSEERLKRFFVKERDGYRVRSELRELVLFAPHDLLKDAPFSRMDLISCRNLLIYLNREAQQRAIDTFHFAMKPGGVLFLGSSEAVDEGMRLFRVVDAKHRLYARQSAPRGGVPLALEPSTLARAMEAVGQASIGPVVHGRGFADPGASPASGVIGRHLDRTAVADLHLRLLERYAPPSVLVNADHDIVHLSEHAGSFLKFSGGEATTNLMRVVAPELRVELRAALFRAADSAQTVHTFRIPMVLEGQPRAVSMRVSHVPEVPGGCLLVLFETDDPLTAPTPLVAPEPGAAPEPAARYLERELEQVKGRLRETVEQYEASTEELKASNEELQAMNEELRSATEELETSREELQSINEELSSVNQEMKSKVDELAGANSYLQNLMASTSIATVFLDRELSVLLYTPAAASLFNLIPGDVGRPLAHLKHNLDHPSLIADAERVLRTLVPVEAEVSAVDSSYLARIQPYRTVDDHIGGLVLTLVDVTERKRAAEALRASEERLRHIVESATDWAIFTMDVKRLVTSWNPGAERIFGYTEADILGRSADVLFMPEERAAGDAERETAQACDAGRARNERWHARKDGATFYGSGSVMPLRASTGEIRGFVKILRDLTDLKRAEDARREQLAELARFGAAAIGREERMIELKREVNDLCGRLGDAERYVIVGEPETSRS